MTHTSKPLSSSPTVAELVKKLLECDQSLSIAVCTNVEATGEVFYVYPSSISIDEPGNDQVVCINIREIDPTVN